MVSKTKKQRLKEKMKTDHTEKVTITLDKSLIDMVRTLQKEMKVKSRSLMINLILEDWVIDADNEIREYENAEDKEAFIKSKLSEVAEKQN